MKYLIQHTFATEKPFHLIPNALNMFLGKRSFNEKFRFGVGKLEDKLFEENSFNGTEITGIITGIFRKNWEFNKERIQKYKSLKYPIEVFHACTAESKFEKRNKDDWNLNLTKDDDYTKRGIAASIFLAKELIAETPIVNFHLGKCSIENKSLGLKAIIKNLKYAAELAEQEGVVVTVENDYQKYEEEMVFGKTAKELKEILEKVNSDFIGVYLDWGHANVQALNEFQKGKLTEKGLRSFKFQKEFIKTLGEKIYYAHIHYNIAHEIEKNEEMKKDFMSIRNKDYHMPINKVEEEYKENYIETLKLLKDKTSIEKCGKIHLELTRDKFFGFIPFNKNGANTSDALESVKILRKIFN